MNLFKLKVTLQGQDETGPYSDTQTFSRLGEGDVQQMKDVSRMLAPVGDTVTYQVTKES